MLKERFLEFGYTEEEYNLIRNSYGINAYTNDTLVKKFIDITSFLLGIGYTKEEVIKMTKTVPAIYSYSIENMQQKISDIIELGYTREEALKMTKTLPFIYGYSIENIKQKISDIISLGYTREEVIKMTRILPQIYGLSIENIKQKISDIIELGYTREEVIKMTRILPQIYGFSIENMNQKINNIIGLGYTREEVIKMTKTLPQIYSYSIENMKQKIEFYDSINMHDLAVVVPKQLMQSAALSYARYKFYLSIGIQINMENYRKLFVGNKQFEKTYGKTKKEILEEYNYDKYMEENKNGRTL